MKAARHVGQTSTEGTHMEEGEHRKKPFFSMLATFLNSVPSTTIEISVCWNWIATLAKESVFELQGRSPPMSLSADVGILCILFFSMQQ